MKKKIIISGITGGILATSLMYGNIDLNKSRDTKVYAASENVKKETIAIQNTTEEKQKIQTLMLNSIDHFKTAKGSFEYFNGDTNELIEYQTDLTMKPRYYEKVQELAIENHSSLKEGDIVGGYEINTYDGENLNIYNNGFPKRNSKPYAYNVKTPPRTQEEVNKYKNSTINKRITVEPDGEKVYIHRLDPSYMRIAKTILLPEDYAMGYMEDSTKWNITGQETIAGIDTVIIEGQLNDYYTTKYNGGNFKLNVDPKTGIMLQMIVTDSSNTVKQFIKTRTIEINKNLDDQLFYSISK
ncbi:hypothetical protein COD67_14430 [Bacillus cereus]|nr:hypothetical protein COI89_05755 [Bacillus cereus]PGU65959.1 hypothetical protein COD67_14430 [Bacillus cereus]